MRELMTFEEYKNISKEKENLIVGWVTFDKDNAVSRIYHSFINSDTIIEVINYNVNFKDYDFSNHITATSNFYVYESTEAFFSSIDKSIRDKIDNPIFKYRGLMQDINQKKEIILDELFTKLKMERPLNLCEIDIKQFNEKLNNYGLHKLYDDLYLHLIIFCGEFINDAALLQGDWILETSSLYPLTSIPIYSDISYNFSINTLLARRLLDSKTKNKGFKIETILKFNMEYNKLKSKVNVEKNK